LRVILRVTSSPTRFVLIEEYVGVHYLSMKSDRLITLSPPSSSGVNGQPVSLFRDGSFFAPAFDSPAGYLVATKSKISN